MTETRTCSNCGRELPIDNFYEHSRTGIPTGRCKECYRVKNQKYRRDNLERLRALESAKRERLKECKPPVPVSIPESAVSLSEAARLYRELTGEEISPKSLAGHAYTFQQWAVFRVIKGSGDQKLVGVRPDRFRSFVQYRKALGVPIFHTRDADLGFVR